MEWMLYCIFAPKRRNCCHLVFEEKNPTTHWGEGAGAKTREHCAVWIREHSTHPSAARAGHNSSLHQLEFEIRVILWLKGENKYQERILNSASELQLKQLRQKPTGQRTVCCLYCPCDWVWMGWFAWKFLKAQETVHSTQHKGLSATTFGCFPLSRGDRDRGPRLGDSGDNPTVEAEMYGWHSNIHTLHSQLLTIGDGTV